MKKEPSAGIILVHESQDLALKAMHRYFFKDLRNVASQLIRRTALKILDAAQAQQLE